jgi:2'-5' RNA ligase
MRLFVGVELDESLRSACAAVSEDLRSQLLKAGATIKVRWIGGENLHITLWFIGHVSEPRAAEIADALRQPWTVAEFPITIEGAGAFPPSGPARIVWLGVTQGAADLTTVFHELTVRLDETGGEALRPYHPHVTIGRVKEIRGGASRTARSVLQASRARAGSGQVRFITLFQSRLSPGGARYEPLLRVPLKEC